MSSVDFALPAVRTQPPIEKVDPHGWGFTLLLAVVATLFVRPADLFPFMENWPIYQVLIIACLILSSRTLVPMLSFKSLKDQPLTCCLLLLLVTVAFSHLIHGSTWEARHFTWQFAKLIALYALVVSVIHTPQRLMSFVTFLTLAIFAISSLALLDEYQILQFGSVASVEDSFAPSETTTIELNRIAWTGIFQDPNDFGLVLVTGIVFAAFKLSKPGIGAARYIWAIPLAIMLVTLTQTHSRGAFLSIVAVIPSWVMHRHGFRRAISSCVVAIPMMAVIFAGRMTEVGSIYHGTGQSRMQIWSETLTIVRQNFLFGIGQGMLVDEIGAVSHNSFLQSFSEVGLIGGTFFVGLFLAGAVQLGPFAGKKSNPQADPEVDRFRTFCFAALIGYTIGLTTLSRVFVGPTYLLLGIATATYRIYGHRLSRGWLVTGDLLPRAFLLSACGLMGFYLLIRLMVRW